MKQTMINILYVVDLEDNTKQSLMALPSGVKCPNDVAECVIRDFYGPLATDNEEPEMQRLVNAICNNEQYDIDGYTFFFDEVTMYVPDEWNTPELNDIVTVTCYGKTKKMTRRAALAEFLDGMKNCEGGEAERYQTIYFQLLDGAMEVSDMIY